MLFVTGKHRDVAKCVPRVVEEPQNVGFAEVSLLLLLPKKGIFGIFLNHLWTEIRDFIKGKYTNQLEKLHKFRATLV